MNYKDIINKIPDNEKPEILRLLRALDDAKQREAAQDNFMDFVKFIWPSFIMGRHHKIIADAFDRVARGELKRVIINLPPRHSKSEMGSYLFPAWYLGKFPEKKIIQASHTAELAVGFGRKVRNLVGSDDYQKIFPGIGLQSDSKAAGRWSTNKGGEYFAIGVGGAIAGKGADCVSFSSKCLTRRGIMTIADVCVGDEVLGYDHKTGAARWTRVRAVSTQRKPEVINVGGVLCTPNHRIFTSKGYEEASRVSDFAVLPMWEKLQKAEGGAREEQEASWTECEVLLFKGLLERSANQSCLPMRSPEVASSDNVQEVLSSKRICGTGLHELRLKVRETILRARKKLEEIWGEGKDFLLSWLLFRSQGKKHYSATPQYGGVCEVQNSYKGWEEVLLNGMLRGPRGEGRGVCRQVVFAEGSGSPQGQGYLRHLREGEKQGCRPSHRSQRQEPRNGEPYSPVRALPQPVSSGVLGACARDFYGILPSEGHWVVDIQTDTENFFCEGVLVHNCLIIDDPHSEGEAISATYDVSVYEKVYQWFLTGPRQRLQPGAAMVVIATRWSLSDLPGRLIKDSISKNGASDWEVIELPAIMPSGEPLWPEYWPLEELLKLKAELPISKWNAQYQQNPTSEEGALIKREWWNVWESEKPPACEAVIVSMDTAFSKTERSDYSACVCFGVFNHPNSVGKPVPNLILLDAWKDKLEFPELKATAVQYYKDWQPDMFIVEKKASGAPLIAELRNAGIPVQEFTPTRATGDKIVRVNAITDIFASGVVWAPDEQFADEVVEECAAFPSGDHDDYVDAVTMALMRFRQGGFMIPTDEDDEIQLPQFRKEPYY